MKLFSILTLLLVPSMVASFVPAPVPTAEKSGFDTFLGTLGVIDDSENPDVIINSALSPPSCIQQRRDMFRTTGSVVASAFVIFGTGGPHSAARAMEEKLYSNNARNMARLKNGDSSGGSVYDNNPPLPKARTRRAIVGCKNASARSLAAESIDKKQLSEKECNMMVMSGESDFMLEALTELDCPTCAYGIGSR